VPAVVVVREVGRGACYAAAAVEREAKSAVLEVKRDEVHVLDVGHVEHNPIVRARFELYTELSSTHSQPHTHTSR